MIETTKKGEMYVPNENGEAILHVDGKPVRAKSNRALEKERAVKLIDRYVRKNLMKLLRAQTIPALGQHFIYRIDEEKDTKGKVIGKKHVLVEDPHEIANALDQIEAGGDHEDEKYYYVTTKEPDFRAADALLNRSLGKPKETILGEIKHTFSLLELGRRADELERLNKGSEDTPADK